MKTKLILIPVLALALSCTSSTFAIFGVINNALQTAYCTTETALRGSFRTVGSIFTPQGWFPNYNSYGYNNYCGCNQNCCRY